MRSKIEHLKQLLQDTFHDADYLAIAFSGGVDSTFLLDVAHEVLGCRVVALTISSAVYPNSEENFTREFCKQKHIKHSVVNCNIFEIDGFKENTKDRCYFCKKSLFQLLYAEAQKICEPHDSKIILADGSNASDEADIRPGARALRELGVISPLSMACITKQEVRNLSQRRALPTWNKPSMACLASRISFGDEITPENLHAVEVAENMLHTHGFEQVRVRVHDNGNLARIEVLPKDISRLFSVMCAQDKAREIHEESERENSRKHDNEHVNSHSHKSERENAESQKNASAPKSNILQQFHELGFSHVSIDVDGYRMGSMNL